MVNKWEAEDRPATTWANERSGENRMSRRTALNPVLSCVAALVPLVANNAFAQDVASNPHSKCLFRQPPRPHCMVFRRQHQRCHRRPRRSLSLGAGRGDPGWQRRPRPPDPAPARLVFRGGPCGIPGSVASHGRSGQPGQQTSTCGRDQLVDLRRGETRRRCPGGTAHLDPGTSLVLADMVHSGVMAH